MTNDGVSADREFLRSILTDVAAGRTSIEDASDSILGEFGRGGRILVVDRSLQELEGELAEIGFLVDGISFAQGIEEMKKALESRILVTRNGQDFETDVARYYYGLVWVESNDDVRTLARRIEAELAAKNLNRNIAQVVRV